MKHPTPEDWMALIYGEADRSLRATLKSHLAQCSDCERRVRDWRAGMIGLDAWPAAGPSPRPNNVIPLFRLAAAALVVAGVGFGVGRFAFPHTADPTLAQDRFRQALRAEFAQLVDERLDDRWSGWKREAASMIASAEAAQRNALDETRRQLGLNLEWVDNQRQVDALEFREALDQMSSARAADYTSLRKALETVAIVAEGNFRETQKDLWLLTSHTPESSPP